jgi:hypothetical protein
MTALCYCLVVKEGDEISLDASWITRCRLTSFATWMTARLQFDKFSKRQQEANRGED